MSFPTERRLSAVRGLAKKIYGAAGKLGGLGDVRFVSVFSDRHCLALANRSILRAHSSRTERDREGARDGPACRRTASAAAPGSTKPAPAKDHGRAAPL